MGVWGTPAVCPPLTCGLLASAGQAPGDFLSCPVSPPLPASPVEMGATQERQGPLAHPSQVRRGPSWGPTWGRRSHSWLGDWEWAADSLPLHTSLSLTSRLFVPQFPTRVTTAQNRMGRCTAVAALDGSHLPPVRRGGQSAHLSGWQVG